MTKSKTANLFHVLCNTLAYGYHAFWSVTPQSATLDTCEPLLNPGSDKFR